MSAIVQSPRPDISNRRRSVRQKVHAPAYASFAGASRNEMLDLYEVLDISEDGVAIQCPSPKQINQQVELCLDLAESSEQLSATATVVWSNAAGRVGLKFPELPEAARYRLREWLFLNAMAGAANAAASSAAPSTTSTLSPLRPNYSDTLDAASAVQREAESMGNDLEAILSLIALRSHSLLRASGAAIALAGNSDDASTMACRASAGSSAPPVGAILQVGTGFSGECVRTARRLRCDDTETDERVDRQSCRALGIRSILAAPIRSGEKVIGLLEVFSARPKAFGESDSSTLQRFAETIASAVNRASRTPRTDDFSGPSPAVAKQFSSAPGSILFANHPDQDTPKQNASSAEDKVGGIRLPRAHLYLLYWVAATIALVLGFILAPWIQEKLHARQRNGEQTVLASTQAPTEASQSPSQTSSVDSPKIEQLRELAKHSNPAAENALGLLYAQGDDKQAFSQNEGQAAWWFTKAAEDGSVPAQYKLSLLYWGGHGVPKDVKKAYFWAVLARAGGQEGGKDLAKVLANGMTRSQAAAIEQQADIWYQQHDSHTKPRPGR
ncbi:MAG: diguanylate cyclase [Acidobacteriaceae bacterium]|nr:diguanylate cyclase [Acidobacteriaceae bacterium]